MDFVHCNNCSRLPGAQNAFFLTSCSHILCQKCLQQFETLSTQQPHMCMVCNAKAKFVEINRSLRPEMQIYFKSPRDLASQYFMNLKAVIEFQEKQRARFMKAQQEKYNKAVKYAKDLHATSRQQAAAEKQLMQEKAHLESENESYKSKLEAMEAKMAEQAKEIERLSRHRQLNNTPKSAYLKRYPSLNGNTPIQPLSFSNVAHSTPNDNIAATQKQKLKSSTPLQDLFGRLDDSIVASDVGLTTPFMLGIKKKDRPPTNAFSEKTKSPGIGALFD